MSFLAMKNSDQYGSYLARKYKDSKNKDIFVRYYYYSRGTRRFLPRLSPNKAQKRRYFAAVKQICRNKDIKGSYFQQAVCKRAPCKQAPREQ